MSVEARLREDICRLAASLFARGLTAGASGNISARTEDGGLLVTPTGSSFGAHDPARLTLFDASMKRVLGEDAGDFFAADVSDDGGSTWVNLETLGTDESAASWTRVDKT